jgi:DNA-binding PadR family transcriptional regulator
MPQRITKQLVAVLVALLTDPRREWYGLELMEGTGLSSGTLYPILHRLVTDGWLERTRDIPSEAGGTERRMYRLTGLGELAAANVLAAQENRARASAPRLRSGLQRA